MQPTAPTSGQGEAADVAPPKYLDRLSRFLCTTGYADLPADVIDRCRTLIADCFAIVTAGHGSPEMRALVEHHLRESRPGPCWVIGTGRRAGPRAAGYLNGVASTWHDFDDGNTTAAVHPGSQMVPAAFAAAQALGVSGKDFLLATVMGYEAMARVGRASRMRVTVPQHGNCGTIGSAVAIARMKGFDAERMRHAINCAATMAMTANRQAMLDEATVRNAYSGHCALAGWQAVEMVESGFRGQRDGIGFTYGVVIADGFDPERAVAGLGDEWLSTQGYFKVHACGRHAHAAIDALQDALASLPDGRIDPACIERIDVRAFKLASLLAGRRIRTSFGAKFSVPFALATLLVHGRSGVDAFDDAAVADERVQALSARIHVEEDPAHTAAYPAVQRCDVVIRTTGGGLHRGHCEIMTGEPGRPLPMALVERKFFDLTVPVWGERRARALHRALMTLERCADMRRFGRGQALPAA